MPDSTRNSESRPPAARTTVAEELKHHRNFPESLGVYLENLSPPAHTPSRGWLRCGYGSSTYDAHREVPIEGFGARIECVVVVELDAAGREIKTPYREWCQRLGLALSCGRCRKDPLDAAHSPCAAIVETEERRRAREAEERRRAREAEESLEKRRHEWVAQANPPECPIVATPPAGAHELVQGIPDRRLAQERARQYSYDYDGVVLVADAGTFDIWASGFKDVPGAGADADPDTDTRSWPIPVLG